jgi:hypothetical protein
MEATKSKYEVDVKLIKSFTPEQFSGKLVIIKITKN